MKDNETNCFSSPGRAVDLDLADAGETAEQPSLVNTTVPQSPTAAVGKSTETQVEVKMAMML